MLFSLNEIDAHCKKAVRGAGFEWGYAEEAGKALRWLAMNDLPGTKVLAAYLTAVDSRINAFHKPSLLTEHIVKTDHNAWYCPIRTGAYLCDRSSIDLPATLEIENLAHPLLLLPYLAFIARDQQTTIEFMFENSRFTYSDPQLNAQIGSSIAVSKTTTAQIDMSDRPVKASRHIRFDQEIDEHDWQILNKFASRTYVPASALSRQGAGSEKDRAR